MRGRINRWRYRRNASLHWRRLGTLKRHECPHCEFHEPREKLLANQWSETPHAESPVSIKILMYWPCDNATSME